MTQPDPITRRKLFTLDEVYRLCVEAGLIFPGPPVWTNPKPLVVKVKYAAT